MYTDSSTIFGSIRINLTSVGFALNSTLVIRVLMHTDLPEPVAPATSRWGIFAKSAKMACPPISLPRPTVSLDLAAAKAGFSSTSLSCTLSSSRFGTSMPIAALPGICSMRTAVAAMFRAISSASPVILLTLTPGAGFTS